MLFHVREILVGREQRQIVANAQLRDDGVYRSHLLTGAAAGVVEFGHRDVVFTFGYQQGNNAHIFDQPEIDDRSFFAQLRTLPALCLSRGCLPQTGDSYRIARADTALKSMV